jgi:hypothetical protein
MCPVCITSAALIAGSVTTTGGITALLVKIFHKSSHQEKNRTDISSNLSDKEK